MNMAKKAQIQIVKEIEALNEEAKLSLVQMFEEMIQMCLFHDMRITGFSSAGNSLQNAVEVGTGYYSPEDSAMIKDGEELESDPISLATLFAKEPVDFLCRKCGLRGEGAWEGDPLRHVYLHHFKQQV